MKDGEMKFQHRESHDFPKDIQPHGTFRAVWFGNYLVVDGATHFPTDACFPGRVECTVDFDEGEFLITIDMTGGRR